MTMSGRGMRMRPGQITFSYSCGCSYLNWKIPRQRAETKGWHLCPDHMARFQEARRANRREFRIKHACGCYYVVWMTGDRDAFGWYFCPAHAAQLKEFQKGE